MFCYPHTRYGPGLSDYYALHYVLPLSKPPREVKTIVYRKLRGIDMELFSNDLQTVFATAPLNNLSEIIEYYNNALRQVLDKHAPQKSKVVTIALVFKRYCCV